MRWKKQIDWGPRPLSHDEWAVLEARIAAPDLLAVDEAVEEITGFMDGFTSELDGEPLTGVTDGQLCVVHHPVTGSAGEREHRIVFFAAGPVGAATPDAFTRLGSAASSLVNHFQTEGITITSIEWTERPYVNRPF